MAYDMMRFDMRRKFGGFEMQLETPETLLQKLEEEAARQAVIAHSDAKAHESAYVTAYQLLRSDVRVGHSTRMKARDIHPRLPVPESDPSR